MTIYKPRAPVCGISEQGGVYLKAEATATEIRLQTFRRSLTDTAPEVQQQLSALTALRRQLSLSETTDNSAASPGYVSKLREFEYQETLFKLFAQQYEQARVDEGREGVPIQVVDAALVAEKRSRPKRLVTVTIAAGLALVIVLVTIFARRGWQRSIAKPDSDVNLRAALGSGFSQGKPL